MARVMQYRVAWPVRDEGRETGRYPHENCLGNRFDCDHLRGGSPGRDERRHAPLRQALSFAPAPLGGQDTGSAWNGRWAGTTVSGQQLVLQLQLQGQRITGRLVVGKQSANIVYGKVVGDAFALTTGPIDGHSVDATGRHVGDTIELTIEGVKQPLTLTRMP